MLVAKLASAMDHPLTAEEQDVFKHMIKPSIPIEGIKENIDPLMRIALS